MVEKISALNGVSGITSKQKAQITVLAYDEIAAKPARFEMAREMLPHITRIAEGIVMQHEQKLDPLEVGKKLFADTGNDSMISWLDASCTYTYEWAKKFLADNEKEKIGTLVAVRKIQMANFILLAKKLSARYPKEEDGLNYIAAQLKELDIKVPDDYQAVEYSISALINDIYTLSKMEWPEELKQIAKILHPPSPTEQISKGE